MPKILYFKYFGCWFCSLIFVLSFLGNFLFGYPENVGIFFFFFFVYGWIHLDFCITLSFFSVSLERDS